MESGALGAGGARLGAQQHPQGATHAGKLAHTMATSGTARKEADGLRDAALLKLTARFLVCFAALFAAIVWLSARTPLVGDLQSATATAAAALMNLTGVVATRSDTLIDVGGRQLQIGADCTGLDRKSVV